MADGGNNSRGKERGGFRGRGAITTGHVSHHTLCTNSVKVLHCFNWIILLLVVAQIASFCQVVNKCLVQFIYFLKFC
jgi:hypothetical protein